MAFNQTTCKTIAQKAAMTSGNMQYPSTQTVWKKETFSCRSNALNVNGDENVCKDVARLLLTVGLNCKDEP